MKRPKVFGQYLNKAKELFKNKETIKGLIKAAAIYAKNNQIAIKDIKRDLLILSNLLKDWGTGRYTEVPVETMLLVIAALLYFISPIDAIPDFLGPIGFTDDITVVGFVVVSIKKDINNYKEWKKKRNKSGEYHS